MGGLSESEMGALEVVWGEQEHGRATALGWWDHGGDARVQGKRGIETDSGAWLSLPLYHIY